MDFDFISRIVPSKEKYYSKVLCFDFSDNDWTTEYDEAAEVDFFKPNEEIGYIRFSGRHEHYTFFTFSNNVSVKIKTLTKKRKIFILQKVLNV